MGIDTHACTRTGQIAIDLALSSNTAELFTFLNTIFQEAENKGEEERGGEGGGMLSAHHSRFSVCSFSVYVLFSA